MSVNSKIRRRRSLVTLTIHLKTNLCFFVALLMQTPAQWNLPYPGQPIAHAFESVLLFFQDCFTPFGAVFRSRRTLFLGPPLLKLCLDCERTIVSNTLYWIARVCRSLSTLTSTRFVARSRSSRCAEETSRTIGPT